MKIQLKFQLYSNPNQINCKIFLFIFSYSLACNLHPEERISYFCFDCLDNCICAECVIHGNNNNNKK